MCEVLVIANKTHISDLASTNTTHYLFITSRYLTLAPLNATERSFFTLRPKGQRGYKFFNEVEILDKVSTSNIAARL